MSTLQPIEINGKTFHVDSAQAEILQQMQARMDGKKKKPPVMEEEEEYDEEEEMMDSSDRLDNISSEDIRMLLDHTEELQAKYDAAIELLQEQMDSDDEDEDEEYDEDESDDEEDEDEEDYQEVLDSYYDSMEAGLLPSDFRLSADMGVADVQKAAILNRMDSSVEEKLSSPEMIAAFYEVLKSSGSTATPSTSRTDSVSSTLYSGLNGKRTVNPNTVSTHELARMDANDPKLDSRLRSMIASVKASREPLN